MPELEAQPSKGPRPEPHLQELASPTRRPATELHALEKSSVVKDRTQSPKGREILIESERDDRQVVENTGLEPVTSGLQSRRSPN